ncbi:hypothetical protein SAMN04515671_2611 [Nakamurella panacisegetis]|uniref:Anti-sigma-D factor RsdA to sigma factor binding region n=1 Tax=Nakamurella panacisegetis TaxID=1090615 RepID=A0A1H0P4W4_9ACTN|nr:hypothetical protein [Nakamurella panacisegetis]SDO99730.1 hypothetical protein SAMN04515671_2611 [Nakamurella panacisegetis]
MGRHRAPELGAGRGSVVLMDTARSTRARAASGDTAGVDFSVAEAVMDDLTLITADDLLLDRIAAGQGDVFPEPATGVRSGPGGLAPLLATWRADIVDPQWPDAPTVDEAIRAAAPKARPARRALRPILGVAVAISALLFGSAAIGAQHAQPGDALWPLAQVLYADHATSVQAGLAVKASLGIARDALVQHQPQSALVALTSASGEVQKVLTTDGKQALQDDLTRLWNEATNSLQATVSGSSPRPTIPDVSRPVVAGTSKPSAGTTRDSGVPPATAADAGRGTGSGSASVHPSTAAAPTVPARTTGPSRATVVPPPVVIPRTTVVTPAPTTASGPSGTDATTTPDPSPSTSPSSTDPGTTAGSQASTETSTTSELPTQTQTPDGQTTAVAPQDVSAADITT